MTVIDADAHVEEWAETFSDRYLDPAFRARRPEVIATETRVHWLIDGHIYPRFAGPARAQPGHSHRLRAPQGHLLRA